MIAWAHPGRDLTIPCAWIRSATEKTFTAQFHFDWFRLPEQ